MSLEQTLGRLKELQKHKEFADEAYEEFAKWETEIQELYSKSELNQHYVIKGLIEGMQVKINYIDDKLKTKRKMKLEERAELFLERDKCRWVVDFFESTEGAIKKLETVISDNLTEIKST